jgi:hypothetical protein
VLPTKKRDLKVVAKQQVTRSTRLQPASKDNQAKEAAPTKIIEKVIESTSKVSEKF